MKFQYGDVIRTADSTTCVRVINIGGLLGEVVPRVKMEKGKRVYRIKWKGFYGYDLVDEKYLIKVVS